MSALTAVDVYLDDLNGDTPLVGSLKPSFMAGRALVSSSFQYDTSYLAHAKAYPVSPELPLRPGREFTPENTSIFGVFADASPDEWGKKIVESNHARLRRKDDSLPSKLGDFDFLVGVSDFSRMGALRLKAEGGSTWLSGDAKVANFHNLERVVATAERYVALKATDEDVAYLSDIATSPGGARPKANVMTRDGELAIVKLPHSKDGNIDTESWEALALTIASRLGMRTPKFETHRVSGEKSVLVSTRFDRTDTGRRIGYISAATALRIGTDGGSRITYEEFADTIAELSFDPASELKEMYARIALTVLINNVDDHWRNHGFLRSGTAWTLSPVFDINPSGRHGVITSRAISDKDDPRDRDIRNLLDIADAYMLTDDQALSLVHSVAREVSKWPAIAEQLGIPRDQWAEMSGAFDDEKIQLAQTLMASHLGHVVSAPSTEPTSGERWVRPHRRGAKSVAGYWRSAR